jgi:hypothetical protein
MYTKSDLQKNYKSPILQRYEGYVFYEQQQNNNSLTCTFQKDIFQKVNKEITDFSW